MITDKNKEKDYEMWDRIKVTVMPATRVKVERAMFGMGYTLNKALEMNGVSLTLCQR